MTTTELIRKMEEHQATKKVRSAWRRGVWAYAFNMVASLDDNTEINTKNALHLLLNGAINWDDYSYKGLAYCYDTDIAETLCTPSELKRTKGGLRNPNRNENWLDTQARALFQAYQLIASCLREDAQE